LSGANSRWVIHRPRRTEARYLHIAPSNEGKTDWEWDNGVRLYADGGVNLKTLKATNLEATDNVYGVNLRASNAVYTDTICNKASTGCFKVGDNNTATFKHVYANNADQASYTQVSVGKGVLFKNGDTRTDDGGKKTFTVRNDDGDLRLQGINGRIRVPQTAVITSLHVGDGELDTTWNKAGLNIRNNDGSWTHFNDGGVNFIRGETKFTNPVQIGSWRIEENATGDLVFKKWKDNKWATNDADNPYFLISAADGNVWVNRSTSRGWISDNIANHTHKYWAPGTGGYQTQTWKTGVA